ncbi:uncharacterized protein UV8b_04875 [Ustilaginoidea virens]|uniref:Uncharacterized protein n=1 Tax=Ustilaginoidea virens TaxID=1159556 RepID=A0A063BWL6_USTVR|nr:uncharacterized protein UV8b_04875 [Ustilaginoidea virens]QUC20634.1 hypothetical protein UV8b_04875 [Ustilaginoidea virens]GAO15303.1 hypothetical protein UVI_02041260 [Ustilaginoidea virens]
MALRNETSSPTAPAPLSSHGRGGAGNMASASQSPKLNPSDLETPVLKTPVVTTGRGGTGNMARNDDPDETRLRQDVGAVPRRYSGGVQHGGRGGAGNVFRGDEESAELAGKASREEAVADDGAGPESDPAGAAGAGAGAGAGAAAKHKSWLFGKKS